MTNTKNQPRKKRFPAGENSKKIVSLALDPTLIAKIDEYAAEHSLSRSRAVETAIACLTGQQSIGFSPATAYSAENSLATPNDCIFASPQVGQAVFY